MVTVVAANSPSVKMHVCLLKTRIFKVHENILRPPKASYKVVFRRVVSVVIQRKGVDVHTNGIDDIAVMLASDFKGKETEREMTKEQGSISW